jgi:hypothetical protein
MPGFSLSPEVRVFACPHCRETINTSMVVCPFCFVSIDSIAAEESAGLTSRVSQACSDASYLKVMAWALVSFVLIMLLPFLGMIGVAGLWFLRFAIPFMTIRWWMRYGSLKTIDPEFSRARTTAVIVGFVGLVALLTAIR